MEQPVVSWPGSKQLARSIQVSTVRVTGKPLRLKPVPGLLRLDIELVRAVRKMARGVIRLGLAGPVARAWLLFDRRRGIRFHGWLASVTQRHQDHTDFWDRASKQYPADENFQRNKVHAALRAGRIAEAESALMHLIASRKARLSDSRFVVGLCNVDARRGTSVQARLRMRRFLVALQGRRDYRLAAVRLSRTIFAHFPRQAARFDAAILRKRFLTMLERSAACSEPAKLLRRAVDVEQMLEDRYHCLLHTDVLPQQRQEFVSMVRGRLFAREAFSFVRIGDGEAACLPYEPGLARHALADAKDRERIWWGRPMDGLVRARFAPRIARAIWDADCIGIPTSARFLREVNLQKEDTLEHSLTGRGLRSVLHCLERVPQLRSAQCAAPSFVSCHLHQDLALWNCYGALLDSIGEIVLISCHPGLGDWVRRAFGVTIAGSIVLPPDRVSAPLLRRHSGESRSLPEILPAVLDQMGDLPRGRLVLVGAGYPGKLLVSEARNRGGVALDVGSIFDYWLGLNTRSYLDLDPR